MSQSLDELTSEVEKLSLAEKEELLRRLIVQMDADPNVSQEEVDIGWHVEIKKRLEDIDSGRVKTIPIEQLYDELDEIDRDYQD